MRFKNNVINKDVAYACGIAEYLLSSESLMMKELRQKNDFAFNSGTGEEVYQKIVKCNKTVPVFTYRPKWFFTKALGMTKNGAIHLNIYAIDKLDPVALVGLLCHEWLHAGPGFTHSNNYKTEFKCNFSVNYFVSENIKRWI